MLACFRQGFVVLPCTEQLRPKDLAQRLRSRSRGSSSPTRATRRRCARPAGPATRSGCRSRRTHLTLPPPAELAPEDPCLITFTSGTAGEPKAVLHGQRYLHRPAPAGRALARARARPTRLVHGRRGLVEVGPQRVHRALASAAPRRCCTTRASTRRSACELIARERVDVLCMAPTEYRVIAKRATLSPLPSLKGVVAAGEALNPEVLHAWHDAIGLWIRDGYGQTETGQLTGAPLGETPRPGSMGKPLPGVRARRRRRRARARPRDRPDVLPALPRRRAAHRRRGTPATASSATRTATCTSRAAPTT